MLNDTAVELLPIIPVSEVGQFVVLAVSPRYSMGLITGAYPGKRSTQMRPLALARLFATTSDRYAGRLSKTNNSLPLKCFGGV